MTFFSYTQNNGAGIGDFLGNLNHALLAAEYLKTPIVDLSSGLDLRTKAFVFCYLGLDSITKNNLQNFHYHFNQSAPIIKFSLLNLWKEIQKHGTREEFLVSLGNPSLLDVELNPACDYDYSSIEFFRSVQNEVGFNGLKSRILQQAVTNSPANRSAKEFKIKLNKKIAVVHIRRGDIAVADCKKLLEAGFKSKSKIIPDEKDILFSLDGKYYSREEFSAHPHAFRFHDVRMFEEQFGEFLNSVNRNEWHVCLVSDGYDKLARRVQKDFEIPFQNEKDLIRFLAAELTVIANNSDFQLIGESPYLLYETIKYIYAADFILRGRTAFSGALLSYLDKSKAKIISVV